jgi:hypothetical protein
VCSTAAAVPAAIERSCWHARCLHITEQRLKNGGTAVCVCSARSAYVYSCFGVLGSVASVIYGLYGSMYVQIAMVQLDDNPKL